jgi:hypothetical protein
MHRGIFQSGQEYHSTSVQQKNELVLAQKFMLGTLEILSGSAGALGANLEILNWFRDITSPTPDDIHFFEQVQCRPTSLW